MLPKNKFIAKNSRPSTIRNQNHGGASEDLGNMTAQSTTLGDFSNAKIQVHPSSNNDTHDTMYYDTDTGYNFSDNNAENWLSTRRSKMMELKNGGLSIQLKTRGYCKLSAGDKIHLTLPITGKDHGKSKIDTFYEGEFLVTKLRLSFEKSSKSVD